MTTIAWDGKTLAVDSMASANGTVISYRVKKLYLSVGRFSAVAISGSVPAMHEVIAWVRSGEKESPPEIEGNLIGITENGDAFALWPNTSKLFLKIEEPWTGGSGWELAMGAMDAGATAIKAVKIASKRDTNTGGRIQSYTFK